MMKGLAGARHSGARFPLKARASGSGHTIPGR